MDEIGKSSKITSNIPPPTELPSFLKKETEKNVEKSENLQKNSIDTKEKDGEQQQKKEEEIESKESQSSVDITEALEPITEGLKNTVFYNWMKTSLKSSIEVAKDSINTMVTVLDPQMSQILNTGGDIEIIVASTNEDKIDSVREAFQDVFKKATVYGKKSTTSVESTIAIQPVGFESAELAAKERLNGLRTNESLVDKTMLSVENFLVEIYKNQWFDVGLLLLSDVRNNLTLKTFTQFTPVPLEIVKILESDTPLNYEKRSTGLQITIGSAMAKKLNVPHYEWHYKYTGITRYDIILNAAKTLASIYKRKLQSKSSSNVSEEK